jgi:carbonic anhydrase
VSVTDELLKANEAYAGEFQSGDLPGAPARKIAVVACMDCRLSIEQMLGLKTGDAIIIRNAGGIVTEDTIRSLIVACRLLGAGEIMVIEHTDCGMSKFKEDALLLKLAGESKNNAISPARFYTFANVEENVREQLGRITSHPWIPSDVQIRGFVYDVKRGKIVEVQA